MKKYGEAEKIKSQADTLEEWERNNKEKEVINNFPIFAKVFIDRRDY